MEFDHTSTPEQHWDNIKKHVFKSGEAPNDIDDIIKKSFEESESDYEKMIILSNFLVLIKQHSDNQQ